jgi:hypothetical protein
MLTDSVYTVAYEIQESGREHSQEYHHQYCPPCSRMLAWKGPTIIFPLSEDASSPVLTFALIHPLLIPISCFLFTAFLV